MILETTNCGKVLPSFSNRVCKLTTSKSGNENLSYRSRTWNRADDVATTLGLMNFHLMSFTRSLALLNLIRKTQ